MWTNESALPGLGLWFSFLALCISYCTIEKITKGITNVQCVGDDEVSFWSDVRVFLSSCDFVQPTIYLKIISVIDLVPVQS